MPDGLAGFRSVGEVSYDELLAGEPITVGGVIGGGQGILLRGTVLGKDGTTGKWLRTAAPKGILVHNTDTTGGDVTSIVHTQGKYKDNVIILPDGSTFSAVKDALHDTGVYLLDVQE